VEARSSTTPVRPRGDAQVEVSLRNVNRGLDIEIDLDGVLDSDSLPPLVARLGVLVGRQPRRLVVDCSALRVEGPDARRFTAALGELAEDLAAEGGTLDVRGRPAPDRS
jgi:hypothetical protein